MADYGITVCGLCKKKFRRARPKSEARAEFNKHFPDASFDNAKEICHDCYEELVEKGFIPNYIKGGKAEPSIEEIFEFVTSEREKGRNDKDISKMMEMINKHGAEYTDILILGMAIQAMGYGRNKQTTSALRAIADVLDSDIETRESLIARMKGELH